MRFNEVTFGIGGAAGDGQASTGDTLARVAARLGLHLYIYNSYQSVIRGGHVWLRLRVAQEKIYSHGDTLDCVVALNQDCVDQHLYELAEGGVLLHNSDSVKVEGIQKGRRALAFPVRELTKSFGRLPAIMQNTVLMGGVAHLLGFPIEKLEEALTKQFQRKGPKVVEQNVGVARAGYEHARKNFEPLRMAAKWQFTGKGRPQITGNELFGLGAVTAGCKFYSAYPMTPASGILGWMADHAEECGIAVKQAEDEISVMNMAVGAGYAGVRSMCATSGGGFALMTEAIGEAGMIEAPVVVINVQRAGPSTGVPTKTEQGDLYQMLGASQGEYPRAIIAPTRLVDCFNTMEEAFNLAERYQMPVLVLSDLLLSEHRETCDLDEFRFDFKIDRGEIAKARENGPYLRYKFTESGVSPRSLPGTPGLIYTAATDEHDEQGVLISDVFTHPPTRRRMMDKRMRKMEGVLRDIPVPKVEGPADAPITLIGWGSSWGPIREGIDELRDRGVTVNHLPIKYIVPFHVKEVLQILSRCKHTLVIENNWGGTFARYLRGETSHEAGGQINKYDGEPFEPKQIADAVQEYIRQGHPAGFRHVCQNAAAFDVAFRH